MNGQWNYPEFRLYEKAKIFGISPSNWMERSKGFISVRIADADAYDAFLWCEERFRDNWVWSSQVQVTWTDIYFINPEDALQFKLTFGPYHETNT